MATTLEERIFVRNFWKMVDEHFREPEHLREFQEWREARMAKEAEEKGEQRRA